MMQSILIMMLVVLVMTAIYTDLRWSRIPNWLTAPAMGLGVVGHAWLGGVDGALFSVAGLGTGLGLFFLIYLVGGIGAGDVKLVAAVGSIIGVTGVLSVGLLSVLAGGLYALGAMGYQWGLATTSKKLAFATYGAFMTGGATGAGDLQLPFKLRYGLAIAAGTLLFLGGIQPFGG